MDDRRFDALTRALGQGGSRRALLKGLLGLGGVAAAGTVLRDTDAARRGSSGPQTPAPQPSTPPQPTAPAPTPAATTVPRCPGNQTPCGADCCCPAGNTKCGSDCCPDGQAECCDGACCYGTCYGEELCCPPGSRACDGVCYPGGCCTDDDCGLLCEVCGSDHVCHSCEEAGQVCQNGTCVPSTTPTPTFTSTPDPCAGVTCTTPPLCHTAPGRCDNGQCSYPQAGAGTDCGACQVCDGAGNCRPVQDNTDPSGECPAGSTCCGGACCSGTCYGEGQCCPTGQPVCSRDGCCEGQCVDEGQFCCPDAGICGDICCLASERCCESSAGASTCNQCCADADCTGARCIDGTCVAFTSTPTNTATATSTHTPTNTPTSTATPTATATPTTVLTPELSKIWFSYIPDGDIGCCYCSARVELLGVQPNWTYEAFLYVWDGPGHPEPASPVESQEIATDGDGAGLIVFNTDINNDVNSSNAQWAKTIVNGVATDWLQASCFNPATSTPTITPLPTNTPTSTNTPTPTPTATPPSTLVVEMGLQIFGSLQTCMAQVLITGAQPSTSYPTSLFVWDGPGHPEPEQPVETIDVFTFGDGQGRGAFRSLVANNTGQYAQVVVLGVGSGWVAVDAATCEP
jgi:hypothetical protein